MAAIGMGPIGIEMAQALARLGIEVHGYGTQDLLGELSDPTINAELRTSLEADISLHIGAKATLRAAGGVNFSRQVRARSAQRNEGRLNVYADAASGRLLGAALCALDGDPLAHLLSLAVSPQRSVSQVLGMPIYHPVHEEGLRSALREAARQPPDAGSSDLAHCEAIGAPALD